MPRGGCDEVDLSVLRQRDTADARGAPTSTTHARSRRRMVTAATTRNTTV